MLYCVPTRDAQTPKNEVTNRDEVSALQCPFTLQALYIKLHLDHILLPSYILCNELPSDPQL